MERPKADFLRAPTETVPGSGTSRVPDHAGLFACRLSTTFASNVTGTTSLVFVGTVNLPAPQTGFAGPMPWNIVIPFTQPYSFVTAQGNLLIDIVGNNPGGGVPTFFLDAVQSGGATTVFGDIGPGAPGNLHFVSVMTGNSLVPRLISPGHTLSFTTLQFQNPPGLFGLGTAAQPVPLDLGPFGAPMNFLYIDPLVLVPHNWIQSSFFGFSATLQLTLPNIPAIVGTTLYGQSALLVPTANPLGLVVSRGVEVRIGDEFEVLPLQQLDASDPIAPTGALADFGAAQPEYGAVAIRLAGVFF